MKRGRQELDDLDHSTAKRFCPFPISASKLDVVRIQETYDKDSPSSGIQFIQEDSEARWRLSLDAIGMMIGGKFLLRKI